MCRSLGSHHRNAPAAYVIVVGALQIYVWYDMIHVVALAWKNILCVQPWTSEVHPSIKLTLKQKIKSHTVANCRWMPRGRSINSELITISIMSRWEIHIKFHFYSFQQVICDVDVNCWLLSLRSNSMCLDLHDLDVAVISLHYRTRFLRTKLQVYVQAEPLVLNAVCVRVT